MTHTQRTTGFVRLVLALLLPACVGDDARQGDVTEGPAPRLGFLAACAADPECESDACVPHAGALVCSTACDPDGSCPDGWSCYTPPGGPGGVRPPYCVSDRWSLCDPCERDADCQLGADDSAACVDYAGVGAFCGPRCAVDADCDEGYSCVGRRTVSGETLTACVNDAGICPCTKYVASLGQTTLCAAENAFGRCLGTRTCDGAVWSDCNAPPAAADYPNGVDDDCDGVTDDITCACGDGVCDPGCDETLDACPCDCAVDGDGVCSPCGESPATTPFDCCRGPGGASGCGDGYCLGNGCGENPDSCPTDCATPCGDGVCQPGENPFNCAEDCLHKVCGNGICEGPDGGPDACPQDCAAFCGNCECEPERDEVLFNCPIDCGFCGDGVCSACANLNEDATTCPKDCCEPSREVCNGLDDDCDGETDEADALGCQRFYVDADQDGLGDAYDGRCLCRASAPYVATIPGDCDDDDFDVRTGDDETCNGEDDDCDAEIDEGYDVGDPCVDNPGGACVVGVRACVSELVSDCVDADPAPTDTVCRSAACLDGVIRPPATCDGAGACILQRYTHCGGYTCTSPERCLTACQTDDDCMDGFACDDAHGRCVRVAPACDDDLDCVDDDPATEDVCLLTCQHLPRAVDPAGDLDGDGVPNGVDGCPETPDPLQLDGDGDGRGDACDDCFASGAAEVCNGQDDDCDGEIDEDFPVGETCAPGGVTCRVGAIACVAGGTAECVVVGLAPAQTLCGDAFCSDAAVMRLAARCRADGVCASGEEIACGAYRCLEDAEGTRCRTTCGEGGDCAGDDFFCAGGVCAPKRDLGERCDAAEACLSGRCVDGVCCDAACEGDCRACDLAGSVGTCAVAPAGYDPREDCADCESCDGAGACAPVAEGLDPGDHCDVGGGCGQTGACDGAGECQLAAPGVGCADAGCANGVLGSGGFCDGEGGCGIVGASACPGQLQCADALTCRTRCEQDNHCVAGHWCRADGTCAPRLGDGAGCGTDRACVSGFCVDGVCCAGPCDGTCETCAAPGMAGVCAPVAGGSDPGRECGRCAACDGARACANVGFGADPKSECGVAPPCGETGACDGAGACAVASPATICEGARCVGDVAFGPRYCTGGGQCATGGAEGTTCAPGMCAAGVCGTGGGCEEASCGVCTTCGAGDACVPVPDGSSQPGCGGERACFGGLCKVLPGGACGTGDVCLSGPCVPDGAGGGVCCDATCDGPCNTCVGTGGMCNAVSQQEASGCDGDDWCVDGSCRAKVGTPCGGPGQGCPDGMRCGGSGVCETLRAPGDECETTAECAEGVCSAQGVCCDSACEGACVTCKGEGTAGTCEAAPRGKDPGGLCGDRQACDGAGACVPLFGGSCGTSADCVDPSTPCVDGVCCDALCDEVCVACAHPGAEGQCIALAGVEDPDGGCALPNWCSAEVPGQCVPFEERDCEEDVDCGEGFRCELDGSCVAKLPDGTPCADDGERCASGHCVDGVCCEAACEGECLTCAGPLMGQCEGYDPGTDPELECGVGAACDADQRCRKALGVPCVLGGECLSGQCVDGVCCDGGCSGVCESCADGMAGPGLCSMVESGEDAPCEGDFACDMGTCRRKLGRPCSSGAQCLSDVCDDDVCCERKCEVCTRCDGAGACAALDGEEDAGGGCSGQRWCVDGVCVERYDGCGEDCDAGSADVVGGDDNDTRGTGTGGSDVGTPHVP